MDTLKQELLDAIRCRSEATYIANLVENHGPQTKRALWEMRRDKTIRLIANGMPITAYAAAYHRGASLFAAADVTEEEITSFKANCIEGDGETFVLAEIR